MSIQGCIELIALALTIAMFFYIAIDGYESDPFDKKGTFKDKSNKNCKEKF